MENDSFVVEKDISEDPKTSMAVVEDPLGNGLGAQTDAHMELLHEVSDTEFCLLPKDEDNSQDPCIEKLELKDQEHKLASSVSTDANKSENSIEEPEKKSSLSKLKTHQKSDAKNVPKNSGTASLKAGAILKKKSSKEAAASASNGRSLHPLKGSVGANLGSSAKTNGGASAKAEAAKLSEAQSSTSGSLLKSALRKSHSNFTVPQPFALATDKRASLGGQLHSAGRVYISSRSFNSQIIREGEKKANDGKGDDTKCQESVKLEESKAQLKASANTFNFNSDVRAERRKEFNSRVEERLTAKEAEKTQAQVKTTEDIQAEIKQFRKSLTFKATPMPSFYHDAPPKPEIKKIPPTRAKSPKLGRRNSTTGAHVGHSHTNHNAKENDSQSKVVKASSQAADPKKSSKKALKQVSGLNASSEKAAPSVLVNETSCKIDESSVGITELEKEGHKAEAELPSEKCNGGELGVLHHVCEEVALNEGQHDFSGGSVQV